MGALNAARVAYTYIDMRTHTGMNILLSMFTFIVDFK